jgi:hypothetical protein
MKDDLTDDIGTTDQEYAPEVEDYRQRIPEGEYVAICYGVEIGHVWGNAARLFIKFRIHEGQYERTELFMVCTYDRKKCKRRSKLYDHFMLFYGRPLTKKDKPHPKMFKGKMCRVIVRDTNPKYPDGEPKPDHFKYSVVDRIVKFITG